MEVFSSATDTIGLRQLRIAIISLLVMIGLGILAVIVAYNVGSKQVNLAHKQNKLAKLTFLLSNIESNISHYYTSLSLVKADAHKKQILIYIDELDIQRKQIMSSIDKLYK